jgi:hypothetical protein
LRILDILSIISYCDDNLTMFTAFKAERSAPKSR